MKIAAAIAGALLGLLFVVFSSIVLFHLVPIPSPPADGSPVALFMGAFVPTGYLTFVKCSELIGGLLVMVPKTRNFGLLVLGPIIINILVFHALVMKAGLFSPDVILIVVLAAFLLFVERKKFLGLLG